MNPRRGSRALGLWVLVACQQVPAATPAPGIAEPGLALYERGIAADGQPVSARHATGGWRLPAAAAACANCHGLRAEGAREGAVAAPSLRWVQDDDASSAALRRALTDGRGRDGRALDPAMPRFDIAARDLDALVHHIARRAAPGVAAHIPRYVTLLPSGNPLRDEAALLDGLDACLAPRAAGDRPTLRWDVRRYDSAQQAVAQWRSLLSDEAVAVVVAPSLRGWSAEFTQLAREGEGAPARAWPLVLFPLVDDPPVLPDGVPVHWLFGGAAERRAAVDIARRQQLPAPDDAARWVAVPARTGAAANQGRARALGAQWAEAACRSVGAIQQAWDAGGAAAQAPAARARLILSRIGRLETIDGLALEPAKAVAVNDWSVWHVGGAGRDAPKLVAPIIRHERVKADSGTARDAGNAAR